MRVPPVGDTPSFWAIHWPYWRARLYCAYHWLPYSMQRLAGPFAGGVLGPAGREHRPAPQPVELDFEAEILDRCEWSPPRAEEPYVNRHWPSDEPPPPPPQVDIVIEKPAPPEARPPGGLFDFFI